MPCFVLQHLQKIRCNFSEIKVQFEHIPFILLTSDNFNESQYSEWHEVFDDVIIVNNVLDLAETKKTIDTYNYISIDNPSLEFVSNDEYCLTLKAQLQQYYLSSSQLDLQAYSLVTDKCAMKSCVKEAGLAVPKFLRFEPDAYQADTVSYLNNVEMTLNYPLIVKPTNQANNRDVHVIKNRDQLSDILQKYSNSENFELESFINGDLYHCNTLIHNGEYQVLMVAEYANPCLQFSQGDPIGSIVLPPNSEIAERINVFNKKVLTALGALPNGITHLEVFNTPENELVFLEIAARAPGAMIPKMSEIHLGVNVEQLNFELQLGSKRALEPGTERDFACWLWYPAPQNTVRGFSEPTINSHVNFNPMINLGFSSNIYSVDPVLAVEIVAHNSNYDSLYQDFNILRSFNPCVTDLYR